MKTPSAIHLFETTSEKIDFLREFKKEATAEEYLYALGELIKGIGVNTMSERSQVSRQTLSKLTNRKSNASYKTIHAIEKSLGFI